MILRFLIITFFACCISHAFAEELASKAALSSLIAAIKEGRHQEAAELVFCKPGQEATALDWVKKVSQKSAKAGGACPEVVTGKEQGTLAIVFVKDVVKNEEGRADYDGILMIKRDDAWKMVLDRREVEDSSKILSPAEREALRELKKWQDETMQTLNNPKN